jgi:hypothetical protein
MSSTLPTQQFTYREQNAQTSALTLDRSGTMRIDLRTLWRVCLKWLRAGWLILAVLFAVHSGAIRPMRVFRGIAHERATGLAAIESNRHWLVPVPESVDTAILTAGIVGGVPGGITAGAVGSAYQKGVSGTPDDRKLVSTSSFDLLVKHPAEAAARIRLLTERVGGFLVKSQTNGAQDATSASIVVRVPAARFAELAAEVRKIGMRVESEEMQSEDVTRQYVDQQAHLRNLRAQEAQYLSILKQARTVKDTLEVSEKMNGVRREIEQQQAEFETLSRQVETVAVSVSLHSEAQAQVFGVPWRPAYELKFAMAQGLEGLANYATSMLGLLFYLPAILLWLATILVGAALGWRLLRLGTRVLFAPKGTGGIETAQSLTN